MNRTEIKPDLDVFPSSIRGYLREAKLFDSSCSETARTLFIDGKTRAFLKTGGRGTLAREQAMTIYMNSHGLAPEVLEYIGEGDRDYLLALALDGEDGIADEHLALPEQLAAAMGEYLRVIHNLPKADCPYPHRTAEMIAESEYSIANGYIDKQILPEEPEQAAERFEELKPGLREDVVIHGDYCLPNIIMQDFRLQGFVDLGSGGVGDRHYDLFWGLWTLEYNMKTNKYGDIFLAAYGREDVDKERLEMCRLLAGFTK